MCFFVFLTRDLGHGGSFTTSYTVYQLTAFDTGFSPSRAPDTSHINTIFHKCNAFSGVSDIGIHHVIQRGEVQARDHQRMIQ